MMITTTQSRSSHTRAFTLIELMIVVAIVAVLSVVAGTAYRRYMDNGRTTEVMAILADIRIKQEAYRAENSVYCNVSANEDAFFPALLTSPGAEPAHKAWTTSTPAGWTQLGLRPGKTTLQCGYSIVADVVANPPTGTRSAAIIGTPTTAWWAATGTCDNDGSGAGTNMTMTTASTTQTIVTQNEHQ